MLNSDAYVNFSLSCAQKGLESESRRPVGGDDEPCSDLPVASPQVQFVPRLGDALIRLGLKLKGLPEAAAPSAYQPVYRAG